MNISPKIPLLFSHNYFNYSIVNFNIVFRFNFSRRKKANFKRDLITIKMQSQTTTTTKRAPLHSVRPEGDGRMRKKRRRVKRQKGKKSGGSGKGKHIHTYTHIHTQKERVEGKENGESGVLLRPPLISLRHKARSL